MNKVKIGGKKVAYVRSGKKNKPKLVFFHPLFGNAKYYEESKKYLEKDFNILSFDFPGFGLSDSYSKKEHNLENYARTANGLLNYLGFKTFHLVGSSLGSMVAIIYTHLYAKRVKKLLLHAPPIDNSSYDFNLREKLMDFASRSDYMIKKVDKIYKKAKVNLNKTGLSAIMKHMERHYPDFDDEYGVIYYSFKTLDLLAAVEVWRNIREIDLSREASKIKKETLVLWGDNDESVRGESMKKLSQLIENSRLEIVKGGIHGIFLQHPAKIALLVKDFLK